MPEAGRPCSTPDCVERIPPQQGSARPRKYCVSCRPPRNRGNPRLIHLPEPEQPDLSEVGLVSAYRSQLESAGRLDTPEGAHVMLLAGLFVSGQHTASGAASLSRELRAAMETALKGAPRKADAVDELSNRRAQKLAGA